MNILLIVLTIFLVAYVVFALSSSDAGQASSDLPESDAAEAEQPVVADKPTTAQPGPSAELSNSGGTGPTRYRNPETGETAAVPTNYRFAKRWIKQALVAEGLLDRVYKNNELDDKGTQKTKTALDKFKGIKKYHE